MKRIPLYDATVPITCTIGDEEIPERVALVERMRSELDRIERTDDGLLLHFPARPDVEADLRRFAVDEKRCCRFWGFAVEESGGSLTLHWDGPPESAALLDALHRWFGGEGSLADIAGLL